MRAIVALSAVLMLGLNLGACASGGSPSRQVRAVVEDETARQAAAAAAQDGAGSKAALKAGADAAAQEKSPTEPPT